MDAGKAWVIVEEHPHGGEPRLLSVISPKRTTDYVSTYMEQMYVDHFASLAEKIAYKKHPRQSPFRIEKYEKRAPVISCGHDPIFRAYYCHKLKLSGHELVFTYKVFREESGHRVPSEHQGSVHAT